VKVFVAGASGAVGRPTVRRLVEAGHEVVGMTRREQRAAARPSWRQGFSEALAA